MNSGIRGESHFPATQWTQLEELRNDQAEQQEGVINGLLGRYWRPVYAWLRRRGYSPDIAEEYTQGFFCDIVLERDLISRADRRRGRFRTFLLTALKGFVSDTYRKEHALKRTAARGTVSLDLEAVAADGPAFVSPDAIFDFMWASDILDRVIVQLEQECRQKDMETHWKVFSAKVLRPIMTGVPDPSYESICRDLDVPDERKAAAMTTTVKRRFRTILRQTVRPHVESDPEVDDEIEELLTILSHTNA